MTLLDALEVWSYLEIPFVWWLFRRFARRDVTGDLIAGTILGAFIEFVTDPIETYHYRFTIYNDVPPAIPLSWGMMFTIATFLSEKAYCRIFRKAALAPYDKRVFLTDWLAGVLVGVPLETIGSKLGVWTYNFSNLQWSGWQIPFFRMPVEIFVGYSLAMLVGPTFVRYWQGSFEGRPPVSGGSAPAP